MSADANHVELLQLNQRLLDAIGGADWATYRELCAADLTCFEPESLGHLIEGLEFHEFYFKLGRSHRAIHTIMTSPHVRVMGDVAVVSYVRINQRASTDGTPSSQSFAETRVWQRQGGQWRHVHFHRSITG